MVLNNLTFLVPDLDPFGTRRLVLTTYSRCVYSTIIVSMEQQCHVRMCHTAEGVKAQLQYKQASKQTKKDNLFTDCEIFEGEGQSLSPYSLTGG